MSDRTITYALLSVGVLGAAVLGACGDDESTGSTVTATSTASAGGSGGTASAGGSGGGALPRPAKSASS